MSLACGRPAELRRTPKSEGFGRAVPAELGSAKLQRGFPPSQAKVSSAFTGLPEDLLGDILSYLPLRERVAVRPAEWRRTRIVYPQLPETAFVLRFYMDMAPSDVPFRVALDTFASLGVPSARFASLAGLPYSWEEAACRAASTESGEGGSIRCRRRLVRALTMRFHDAAFLGLTEVVAFRELRDLFAAEEAGCGGSRDAAAAGSIFR
jgi:hypothetical protein